MQSRSQSSPHTRTPHSHRQEIDGRQDGFHTRNDASIWTSAVASLEQSDFAAEEERHGQPNEAPIPIGDPQASGAISPSLNPEQSEPSTTLQPSAAPGLGESVEPALALDGFPNEVLTHIFSHLPPSSLQTISLVSHRLHALVTTPHAWRIAFSRYFPGNSHEESAARSGSGKTPTKDTEDNVASGRRSFTRLTPTASWRSEYILRTHLLRSLARGRPAQLLNLGGHGASRPAGGSSSNAQTTYNSGLWGLLDRLDVVFGAGKPNLVRAIHGASDLGSATLSDPLSGKVDSSGLAIPHALLQFHERFPGEAEYGLGAGDVVGIPNMMDVSAIHGLVYAEGSPGASVHYRAHDEHRARPLARSQDYGSPDLGIPHLNAVYETICSIWIAKTKALPHLTKGLVGIMSGSSSGVVTAYSLGYNDARGRRLEKGEITARWVLSPGVPIISIAVDEQLTQTRLEHSRIWCVALNALGESFYITGLPERSQVAPTVKLSPRAADELAWATGRSVPWCLIESTRRVANSSSFEEFDVDGSYSPRSSWDGSELNTEQISAETREIESFAKKTPKHFRQACNGWDMQRILQVDFAGDDGNKAGEAIFIIICGHQSSKAMSITRLTRTRSRNTAYQFDQSPRTTTIVQAVEEINENPPRNRPPVSSPASSRQSSIGSDTTLHLLDLWYSTDFTMVETLFPIMATAIDSSATALLTVDEDPLLTPEQDAGPLPAIASSESRSSMKSGPRRIPGQRARLIAMGTKNGTVLLWNMRAPIAGQSSITNAIDPVRIIRTDSPEISCLAVTALYVVHGGNDGLVQAWDPLASVVGPVRTLNSRFSSRARRRLVQAESSAQGVGVNLFAAGAISLDPDPTVLRGMVTLGTHVRFWAYSSQSAERHKSNKRRVRRSARGSNQSTDPFNHSGRGALEGYINAEKIEMERDRDLRRREKERLAGRFGIDILGPEATEKEVLAYAKMLSEESMLEDEAKRSTASSSSGDYTPSDELSLDRSGLPFTGTNAGETDVMEGQFAADIERAIQRSLIDDSASESEPVLPSTISTSYPIRYRRNRRYAAELASNSPDLEPEEADIKFALQLSLAEATSQAGVGSSSTAPRSPPDELIVPRGKAPEDATKM